MISATTLCKELLNVNSLIVDDADFFTNKYGELCILIKVHLRKGLQWKCPVCGKEMEKGYIQTMQRIGWVKALHKLSLLPKSGEIMLANHVMTGEIGRAHV